MVSCDLNLGIFRFNKKQFTQTAVSLFCLVVFAQNGFADDVNLANPSSARFGGFVEGYYAYDFGHPATGDRAFTTHSARDNEFNINLAYVEAIYEKKRLRSRLALQAGTSVQANYASEPAYGQVSGPSLAQHIQEARIGYQVTDATWIDAGIFFSHLGAESFISKDNLTLTRSMVADGSPYYLSGVKVSHQFTKEFSTQLLVVNGWQNISENNPDKSVGTGGTFNNGTFSISYNALFGNEIAAPTATGGRGLSRFRHYHNFIFRTQIHERVEFVAEVDFGFQRLQAGSVDNPWSGASVIARYSLDEATAIPVRFEYFDDPDQIIWNNGTADRSFAYGGSVGFDKKLVDTLLWRSEMRHLISPRDIFPDGTGRRQTNTVLITSLAVSF